MIPKVIKKTNKLPYMPIIIYLSSVKETYQLSSVFQKFDPNHHFRDCILIELSF